MSFLSFVIPGDKFMVGVPKEPPKVPAGWMLRTSQFDFAAAIDPEGVEWIIGTDGVLHEVKVNPQMARVFTGRTRTVEPPYGTTTVEDGLKAGGA